METIHSIHADHSTLLIAKAVETTTTTKLPNCNVILENVLLEVVDYDPTTEPDQDDDDMPVIQLEKADKVRRSPSSSIEEAHAVVIMDSSPSSQQQQQQQAVEDLNGIHEEQAILDPRAAEAAATSRNRTLLSRGSRSSSNIPGYSPRDILDADDDDLFVGGVEETLREIQESEARAEFLSIMMPPPSPVVQTSLMKEIGINFLEDQPGVVDSVDDESPTLFADLAAIIQPGDVLVSINGKHMQQQQQQQQQQELSNSQLLSMMQDLYTKKGLILVFQNTQSNARGNVVASVLTKPSGTSLLGIKLGSYGRGRKIKITEILTHGITAQSLLNVGDTILMVNGVPCVNSTTNHVVDVLRGSPKYVYIVAQTGVRNAVTIAECSSSTTSAVTAAVSSLNMLLLLPFGGRS